MKLDECRTSGVVILLLCPLLLSKQRKAAGARNSSPAVLSFHGGRNSGSRRATGREVGVESLAQFLPP